jgi:hypothetical protein
MMEGVCQPQWVAPRTATSSVCHDKFVLTQSNTFVWRSPAISVEIRHQDFQYLKDLSYTVSSGYFNPPGRPYCM